MVLHHSSVTYIVSTCRLAPTMFHIFQYCKEWSYMDHCKIIVWEKCDVMTLSCSRFICTNFTGGLVACTDNFPFHHKLCSPQLDCSVLVVRSSLLGLGQILFFFSGLTKCYKHLCLCWFDSLFWHNHFKQGKLSIRARKKIEAKAFDKEIGATPI